MNVTSSGHGCACRESVPKGQSMDWQSLWDEVRDRGMCALQQESRVLERMWSLKASNLCLFSKIEIEA
jgi:hypothetical protein